jgi:hypothetical protein
MLLGLTISQFLGYAAVIVALINTLYALRRIWIGEIKPHAFSVFIWALLTGIAFVNMLVQGIDETAYRSGVMAALLLVNFLFCMRQGFGYITRSDWIFLGAALATIPLWITTKNPDLALYWLLVIEILGTIPTLRKAWVLPYELSAIVYFFVAFAQGLQLASLMTSSNDYSFALFLYMLMFPIMWMLAVAVLLYRRTQVLKTV